MGVATANDSLGILSGPPATLCAVHPMAVNHLEVFLFESEGQEGQRADFLLTEHCMFIAATFLAHQREIPQTDWKHHLT